MKKTREKKTVKQTDLEVIVMKTTSELTSTVEVCTVFDVKDETSTFRKDGSQN
jgi:hypothetical protein